VMGWGARRSGLFGCGAVNQRFNTEDTEKGLRARRVLGAVLCCAEAQGVVRRHGLAVLDFAGSGFAFAGGFAVCAFALAATFRSETSEL
jgi:hypothetical protein